MMGTMECGIKVVMEIGRSVQIVTQGCGWTEKESQKTTITLPITVLAKVERKE